MNKKIIKIAQLFTPPMTPAGAEFKPATASGGANDFLSTMKRHDALDRVAEDLPDRTDKLYRDTDITKNLSKKINIQK